MTPASILYAAAFRIATSATNLGLKPPVLYGKSSAHMLAMPGAESSPTTATKRAASSCATGLLRIAVSSGNPLTIPWAMSLTD
jgi:hypothetical protein